MCGRFTITGHGIDAKRQRAYLRQRFGIDDPNPGDLGPADWDELDRLGYGRYNVAPAQPLLTVERTEDGRRRFGSRVWGIRPPRSKRPYMNARDDALLKRWSYLMDSGHRVAIPADGWYEWTKPEKPGGDRQPWRFTVDDGGLFAFAGLANEEHALIITTDANPTAARVHDRMPAVLADDDRLGAWLDPSLSPEEAAGLIEPLAEGRVAVAPANPLVNSWRNDGPELLEPGRPEADPEPQQETLEGF
jgi:putative SOS response-associated peptidase YedK